MTSNNIDAALSPLSRSRESRAPVSVCLACYNGERYIAEQLNSVLDQLLPYDEIIVSDDASTDQTAAVVHALKDNRIRFHQNECGLGIVRNFEQALAHARNDLIFLCDQDDIWLPGKVDRMVASLNNAVMVVSDCRVVDASLATLYPSFFARLGSRPGILRNLWRNTYLGCCIAFHRRLLKRALPIPTKVPMHDMWLGLTAQTLGQVIFLPEVLSLYRRHGAASSDGGRTSTSSRLQQLKWRWRLVSALVIRWGFGR
ncbi:MAG: glycosyltransferase family 2 protein [Betaproteobacteria bacterium]|jgi:glycosyltransferase involved in cell wall biosynthesis|nr:glycosyltransferase family 2 protein [Betaproteobacteria bacterium]